VSPNWGDGLAPTFASAASPNHFPSFLSALSTMTLASIVAATDKRTSGLRARPFSSEQGQGPESLQHRICLPWHYRDPPIDSRGHTHHRSSRSIGAQRRTLRPRRNRRWAAQPGRPSRGTLIEAKAIASTLDSSMTCSVSPTSPEVRLDGPQTSTAKPPCNWPAGIVLRGAR
jgi:hypothetical protein